MKWSHVMALALFAGVGAGLAVLMMRPGERVDLPPVKVEVGDYTAFWPDGDERPMLYTLASCPVCRVAKEALGELDVDYIEKSLDADPSLRNELRDLGARAVPVLIVGRHKVEGFDEQAFREALGAESALPTAAL